MSALHRTPKFDAMAATSRNADLFQSRQFFCVSDFGVAIISPLLTKRADLIDLGGFGRFILVGHFLSMSLAQYFFSSVVTSLSQSEIRFTTKPNYHHYAKSSRRHLMGRIGCLLRQLNISWFKLKHCDLAVGQ